MNDLIAERMNLGFLICAISVFVWASIDYNRFIKFWMVRPAPYSRRVLIFFRLFFLASVLGGLWQAVKTAIASARPVIYLSSIPFAVGCFVVCFLMIHLAEWVNRKRG